MNNGSVEFKEPEVLEIQVEDINYIPSYKIAELERQTNENQRIINELDREANETKRETYYEDIQNKVDAGYFNGDSGVYVGTEEPPDESVNVLINPNGEGSGELATKGYVNEEFEKVNKYLKSFYCNNVAAMKQADLKNGDYVQTAGYYNANDGGGTLYLIREKTENDVEDLGSIHFIGDSLVAELIVNSDVNVKQFGAKADNTTDDSIYIQTAINYLKNKVITNNKIDLETLYIPNGVYKVSNQIILSPLVKLKTKGSVIVNSYVENDSTFWIKPTTEDNEQWYHYNGIYIDGIDGIQVNSFTNNGIALEIGEKTNVGSFKGLMHTSINNLFFKDFNIGIKVNPINVYCDTFNSLKFVNCKYNFQWGDDSLSLINSGERITFNDCQFGSKGTLVMINLYQAVGSMFFNNCSFDYGNCVFNDGGNKGHTYISCNQCHFEGCNNNMTVEELNSLPNGIVYGDFIKSIVSITNSHIGLTNPLDIKMFKYFSNSVAEYTKYKLILKNCFVGSSFVSSNPESCYYIDENVNASVENCGNTLSQSLFPNRKLNLVPHPHFDNAEVGTISINAGLGGNKNHYNPGFEDSAEIIKDESTNYNVLKLTAKTEKSSIQILADYISVTPNDILIANACTKNFYKVTIDFDCYDESKQLVASIERTPHYPSEMLPTKEDIYSQPYVIQTSLPARTRYVQMRYVFSNSNASEVVGIGENCYIYGLNVYKI